MDTSPHTSAFVHVNGIHLHYLDWGGPGPVLLFLTGMGCFAHIFDRFAPRFVEDFRVLALDRRGHGDSDYPETGYDACARKRCQMASGKADQRVHTGVHSSLNHAARALAVCTAPGMIHCAPVHLRR